MKNHERRVEEILKLAEELPRGLPEEVDGFVRKALALTSRYSYNMDRISDQPFSN